MRFGLLTQWYDPEPRPAALPEVLARGLQAAGHEVQVLTGFPSNPARARTFAAQRGVDAVEALQRQAAAERVAA
jgi:hypothetical protein